MKRQFVVLLATFLLYWSSIQSSQPLVNEAMLTRLKNDYSDQAYRRGQALNKLISELQGQPLHTQLKEINRFYNQFQYREDIDQWGQKDYWATPEEFLGIQKGDCEDFVVSKYFALRKLGVPDNRLFLTYVKHLKLNVAHMVLSYFETPTSNPLILDNYNPAIVEGSKRRDLLPVYSFNANSLFLTNASAGLGRSLPTDKIKNSKWQNLLAEIRKEQQ